MQLVQGLERAEVVEAVSTEGEAKVRGVDGVSALVVVVES